MLQKLYPLGGAVLLFLSYPSYNLPALKLFPFFAWFALVPFLLYARREPSVKRLYTRLFGLSLCANMLMYGWMGSFGNTIPHGDIVLLSLFIPTLSVLLASRIFLCEILSRRYPHLRFLLYPAVWVFLDFLQSYGYLAFPWTYLGYSQYPVLPLIQTASVTGIYGITFLLIFSNTVISDMVYTCDGSEIRQYLKPRYLVLYIVVPLLFLSGGMRIFVAHQGNDKRTLTVSLIQTCISPWENWMSNRYRYLNELIEMTNSALDSMKTDLVIWSESATLEPLTYYVNAHVPDRFADNLVKYVRAIDVPLLTAEIGEFESEDGSKVEYTNSACVIETDGSIGQQYSKIHLAPIGEWFPYERWFPGLRGYLESMGGSSFTPGRTPYLFSVDTFKYACLICYEGMFPRLTSFYKRQGADFLVNITNDGWSDYYSGHMQHYAASVFRAVENGIWYVRVGNTGYTVLLDPYGREVESIPILIPGYINGKIDVSLNRETFYARYGDVAVYCMIFITCFLLIYSEFFRKGKRK